MTGRPSRWAGVLLEASMILLVGYVVLSLIRSHLGDCYPVSTPSMEPTFHGDPRDGDLVLVDKTAWWWSEPEPFDTVVIRNPIPGKELIVKRFIARGPVDLRLKDGDLFLGARGAELKRVEKHPVKHRDLRFVVFRHPHGPCEQTLEEFCHLPPDRARVGADGVMRLDAAAPTAGEIERLVRDAAQKATRHSPASVPGFVATHKPVDTSFLNPGGRRRWEAVNHYPDIGCELEVHTGTGVTALVFVHEYLDREVVVLWHRDGRVEILAKGVVVHRAPSGGKGFRADEPMRVAFGYLDGRVFLTKDEGVVLLHAVELPLSEPGRTVSRRFNGLRFAVAGGSIRVCEITVFRDFAATGIGGVYGRGENVYHVDAGQMFLLGDNPHDSTDSRTTSEFETGLLVGRPYAILAPRRRARVLPR